MKIRNFMIVLLAVLMAFAFASCKNNPEPEPEPQPGAKTVGKLTVTENDITKSVWSYEKIALNWDLTKSLGDDTEGIKDGSVLILKFRTNRNPYEFDIRTNKKGVIDKATGTDAKTDVRWVYQEHADSLDSLTYDEKTGWYTMKYTFTDDASASYAAPEYDKYKYINLGVNFKCFLLKDDVFEIKEATLDGKALAITSDVMAGKNTTFEAIDDHTWTMPETYVVVYAVGEWRSDDGQEAEAVAAGGKASGLVKAGYTVTYTDEDGEPFDLNTPITEDIVLDCTLTPVS